MPQAHTVSSSFFRLVLQAFVAALTLAALPALAQKPPCRVDSPNHTLCEFPSMQAVVRWTVPAGVTEVGVLAIGAMGGSKPCQNGGPGAVAQGTFKVKPGEVISVMVGQTGGLSPTRPNNGAGGGGGSFAWRGSGPISLQNVMVAGGGGGGAGCKGTARAGSPGPEARNGVGGDRNSGVAGNNGQGGGGGLSTGFQPTGAGGGGGGGILSDGGDKNDPSSNQDWSLSGGWGGKSIASGGQGGAPGIAYSNSTNQRGERGGQPLSQGGWGGFGGGGGGGGWYEDLIQARCTDRTAGGGGGGGGYSGGGGGSEGSSVASDMGSNCGNYGNGGGGGGSFVAKDAVNPTMQEAKVTDYKQSRDGMLLIGYYMPK